MTTKETLTTTALHKFNEVFKQRPGMLGTAYQIESMFHLFDQLWFIQKYEQEFEYQYSWHAYLVEQKYIIQGHNQLLQTLLDTPDDYDLLHNLRRKYRLWIKAKTSHIVSQQSRTLQL